MIINSKNINSVRCPMMNGLACMGSCCALWRPLNAEDGFCGAGGALTENSGSVAEGEQTGRVARHTTKGSPERRR